MTPQPAAGEQVPRDTIGSGLRPAGMASLDAACELLRALGAPHRLAIVLDLADGPRCVHELVSALGISQSLTSQHLRVLRSTGLVTAARRGKESVYSLADEHVAHIARDALTHGTETGAASTAAPANAALANAALATQGV